MAQNETTGKVRKIIFKVEKSCGMHAYYISIIHSLENTGNLAEFTEL